MNITPHEFQYLKEQAVTKIIQILVEEQNMTIEDAFDKMYSSTLFEKLSDERTGLFFQSPRYLLSYLN